MSHYVAPFLVLNLGSEMVFVVAQRLQAQNVPHERTNLVLDEIISILISKQLMADLMKRQVSCSHDALRDIIEDIAQSSVMRLDPISMNKLWDLITMVFKWQATVSDDLLAITLRHLYEIENYITNPETQLQLHKIQNLIENFNKILTNQEKKKLRDDILHWLKDSHVRVSLLLRMGLQDMDGLFITENLDPLAEKMLKNLGENIYSATQNGKIMETNQNKQEAEVNELKFFVDQILGDRSLGSENGNRKILRLAISDQNGNDDVDDELNVEVNTDGNQLQDIVKELTLGDAEEGVLKEDLLAMIGGED